MEAMCANHPERSAQSLCHSCGLSYCMECLTEGLVYYYCAKTECQARLHEESLPEIVTCPSCKEELQLTTEERIEKKFWCPECKRVTSLSATGEERAHLLASQSVQPSEAKFIRLTARTRFVSDLLMTSIVIGVSAVLLFAVIRNEFHGTVKKSAKTSEFEKEGFDASTDAAKSSVKSGLAKAKSRDYRGAIEDFTEAISVDPGYVFAYSQRASARIYCHDFRGASEDYDKAISLNDQYAPAYVGRAVVKDLWKDYQGALDDCEKALEIDPTFARAYVERGMVQSNLGEYQRALEDYNKAIDFDNQYAPSYTGRATAKYRLGDLHGAMLDFDTAIAVNPKYQASYIGRGTARSYIGDYQGAIADLDKAISLDSADADAFRRRGGVKVEVGDYQGAIQDYSKSIDLEPSNSEAYVARGMVIMAGSRKADVDRAQIEAAEKDFTRAIALNPQDGLAYRCRGATKAVLGDQAAACEDITMAIELGVDVPEEEREPCEQSGGQTIRFNSEIGDHYRHKDRARSRDMVGCMGLGGKVSSTIFCSEIPVLQRQPGSNMK